MLTYICDKQSHISSVIPESNLPCISPLEIHHVVNIDCFVKIIIHNLPLGGFRSLVIFKISDKSIHSRFTLNKNYPWLRFLIVINAARAGILLLRKYLLNIYMNAKQNLKEKKR